METTFLVILTLLFVIFQTYGASSNTTTITVSSNVICIERERQSLLLIKQSLTNESNLLSTWTGIECCMWEGVGCDNRTGHVVRLQLSSCLAIKVSNLTALENFSHLRWLELSRNEIGPEFPKWLQTLTGLQVLRLSNTRIRDRIPEWFQNFSYLEVLDLSDNEIGGDLAQIIRNNTGLKVVLLGKNHFTEIIPTNLCELHTIQVLDLSHNNFFGILPACLGNLIQLQVMDFTSNKITGDIPNSLGALSKLESLHLHNNKFEGNLPMSLQNLKSLITMDLGKNLLSGNIPLWIGKKLSNLEILNLASNMLTGKIPLELCQMKTLQYLSLASNSITGNIPQCFGNLSGMIKSDDELGNYIIYYEENIEAYNKGIQLNYTSTVRFLISLDLSSNKLTGEIPNMLMNLEALKSLNLSRNELSGRIPTMIGNLKSMESLDLSSNKLFGRIPQSLASLNSLGYLNLSFNKLSGPLPVGNHFQTFDDPAMYEGNNELCGFPLLSCNTHDSDDEGENGSQGFSWFYAGMVPGFIVGFMGLIASLHYVSIVSTITMCLILKHRLITYILLLM